MNNEFVHMHLEFMSYALGILNDFNKLFQSETPLLHVLKEETEKMLKDLCSNYMEMSYVRKTPVLKIEHSNPRYFLKLEDVYIGVKAQHSFNELKEKPDIKICSRVFSKIPFTDFKEISSFKNIRYN